MQSLLTAFVLAAFACPDDDPRGIALEAAIHLRAIAHCQRENLSERLAQHVKELIAYYPETPIGRFMRRGIMP